MPATTTYALTGNAYIDGILGDWKWAVSDFTFSFPASASFYGYGYGSGEPLKGFATFNAAQMTAARAAFDQFASVANVTLTEITESATKHGDLRLASSDAPSTAWAYFPSTAAEGGDAWFDKSSGYYSRPVKGNYAYTTFLHEIGHALGLEHAHEGNVMPANRDSMEYTVMSYRSYVGASTTTGYTNETWGFAQSLMMYDIAAIQHMYGADFTTHSENTTYCWNQATGEMSINGVAQGAPGGNKILLTVWDGGGIDTYDFSNYATALKVDLRPGEWTTTSSAQLARLRYDGSKVAVGNIANALQYKGDARSLIENAKGGAGNDTITGNAAANTLWGNAGKDTLIGGDGNDNLVGGIGADRLDGGNGSDLANYYRAAAGIVADLHSPGANSGEAAGDTYVSVERLYGSAFNDTLRGDNLANLLNGLGGNDVLHGRDGNDTLIGGGGADRLIGGSGADTFVFQTTVQSAPAARDIIEDFASGVDRIDLRSIDANSNNSGDQAFLFIGSNAFHGRAGELNVKNGVIAGDINGDGLADFQVKALNLSVLSGADFFL
ncbi:possible protease (plasmid) [Sinorhizobium fredii NGR234]|uniref:Possible protease n=1 Tax=Sinorhizobium fredii (strain NBRC 101917 / NGR234) TaxID=394 RepID=C3KQA8_SINFN|nr:M10 family metallopeptidase C-terminal domain-containing protein [Sinorhizobium fredii]ACP22266.1 possible protease [Sinorhizobium fredii NGR234]